MSQTSGFGLQASATGGHRRFLAGRCLCVKASRRGHTLAELMVVITFFSVLMVMATRLIVLMYGSERTARKDMVAAIGLDRLAVQFQRDVRGATKVLHIARAPATGEEVLPPSTPGQPRRAVILRLQVADAVVEYATADGNITRTLLAGDANARAAPEREQFRLSDTARVEIELEPSNGAARQVLALTVRKVGPAEAEDTTRGREIARLRVQAVLGADLRFVHPKAKDGA